MIVYTYIIKYIKPASTAVSQKKARLGLRHASLRYFFPHTTCPPNVSRFNYTTQHRYNCPQANTALTMA